MVSHDTGFLDEAAMCAKESEVLGMARRFPTKTNFYHLLVPKRKKRGKERETDNYFPANFELNSKPMKTTINFLEEKDSKSLSNTTFVSIAPLDC